MGYQHTIYLFSDSHFYAQQFVTLASYTCWAEAFPIKEITAEAVAETFLNNWIYRFVCPKTIITDQGRQFESTLFHSLSTLLGIILNILDWRFRSTPHHPQTNSMIERWHRSLKTAIKYHDSQNSTEVLPTMLMGLRSAKTDTSALQKWVMVLL
ncbi:hypothetical protein WA026_012742 [Henosepilachna vigintioctopunctata]|uniref:Integrase catalytic domain-containing protein n=1 Tax=Henosepilachna vigintioctopunctata TaxID=420089 RepID=A0AAW1U1L8_9CUCU